MLKIVTKEIFTVTNCTSTSLNFSPLHRKKIEAKFKGGHITSDGGLLLVREMDKKLQLTKQLSKVIDDHRHPGYVQHSVEHLFKQRVYAIAASYEDVNDHDTLRQDACFQVAVGQDVELASSSTLSRFENAIDQSSLVAMSQVFVEHFIRVQTQVPTELILDFDPTDHTLYRKQEDCQSRT